MKENDLAFAFSETICFHYIDARKSAPLDFTESSARKNATVRMVVLVITWPAHVAVYRGLLDPLAPYEVSVSSFVDKSLPPKICTPSHKKNVFTFNDYQYYNSDVLSLSDGHLVSLSYTACDDWKYGDNCNIPCQCNTTYADRWGYKISEKNINELFLYCNPSRKKSLAYLHV